LAGFATIGVLPSLLYVPIEEKARAPSRFKVTRVALRSSKPASYLHFWVKKVNSTLPFAPIMQRNRFGFSDFVLSRYASPMIIVFTFVSSIWVVSYLTQQALGPALRRKKFPRPGDDERHMKADLI
jgi:hypothetical protein